MSWTYDYDGDADETTIYWDSDEQATIDGRISRWKNGYPATDEPREAVAKAIQNAGTPDRIRMQFDLNYGFSERDDDSS